MLSVQYDPANDCPYPECPNRGRYTSHYHCPRPECTDHAPTSYMGHYMLDADRTVCDPAERRAITQHMYEERKATQP